ncbi:hypothetical protein ACFE04_016405 [Oxalis oulophora]
MKIYEGVVFGTNGKDQWPDAGGLDVIPPQVKKKPSRKRKLRLKRPEESSDKTKKSRVNTPQHCKKYGRPGHNMRTCKGIVVIEDQNVEGSQSTTQAHVEDATTEPSIYLPESAYADMLLSENISRIQVVPATTMIVPSPIVNSVNLPTRRDNGKSNRTGRGGERMVVSTQ